jgi:hypothetical protein
MHSRLTRHGWQGGRHARRQPLSKSSCKSSPCTLPTPRPHQSQRHPPTHPASQPASQTDRQTDRQTATHLCQHGRVHELVVGDGVELHPLVEFVGLAAHQHCRQCAAVKMYLCVASADDDDAGRQPPSTHAPIPHPQRAAHHPPVPACCSHAPGTRCAAAIMATAAVPTRDSTVPFDITEAAPRNTCRQAGRQEPGASGECGAH